MNEWGIYGQLFSFSLASGYDSTNGFTVTLGSQRHLSDSQWPHHSQLVLWRAMKAGLHTAGQAPLHLLHNQCHRLL